MIKRTQILAVALIAAAGAAAPATEAAKSKRVASEVEVSGANFQNKPPFPSRVVGDVHSKKPKCERNREVSLYRTPEGGGPRELLDTVTTDRTGDWEVFTDDAFSGDTWDATVARRKVNKPGKDIVCKADESPPLVIDAVV